MATVLSALGEPLTQGDPQALIGAMTATVSERITSDLVECSGKSTSCVVMAALGSQPSPSLLAVDLWASLCASVSSFVKWYDHT